MAESVRGLKAWVLAARPKTLAGAAIATVALPSAAPIICIYVLLHIFTFRQMRRHTGRDLNRIIGTTARNIFIFGLLLAVFLHFT